MEGIVVQSFLETIFFFSEKSHTYIDFKDYGSANPHKIPEKSDVKIECI